MTKPRVLIIGAGLGGLTLAQSLHRAGIDARLFERDHDPFERLQGYRLHLDVDGIMAMREVLAPELRSVFEATSFFTEPFTTLLGLDLSVRKRLLSDDGDGGDVWPARSGGQEHANVDRATVRQLLLAGLEDRVSYGKTLDRYESGPAGVIAYFSDGTSMEGDILVGADGVRSAVRRQRAPHCEMMDAGITALYGRIDVDTARYAVPPEVLQDIFCIAIDERKVFLGLGAVRFPMPPQEAVGRFAPSAAMLPQDDYLVCVIGGRHQFFPDRLRDVSSADLHRIAVETVRSWPTRASGLIQAADPSAFFAVRMSTSIPCALDPPTNVTLLGDAIHAMTPTLGRGANLAMRDGALLGRAIRAIDAGEMSCADALGGYETQMLGYSFEVVKESARVGWERMAQTPLPG